MAEVDKLIVRIEADMRQLKKSLNETQKRTQQTTKSMRQGFDQIKGALGGVTASVLSLKGAIVGLGAGLAAKALVNVGNQVESLQIRLETLFGSTEEGGKAFDKMAEFASKVPFSLQEIQAGAGSLVAVSKDADELSRLLEITGTVAAASGLDFATASQQIQRSLSAGVGAADLFREKGVTAMLGFKAGVQVSVKESREALEKFAKDNDGITDRLAGTFAGTMSMLGDAVFTFQRTINDAGFFSELKRHFEDLRKTIADNQPAIQAFAKDISDVLVGAMNLLRDALVFVARNFDLLIIAIKAFIAFKLAGIVFTITQGFIAMAKAIAVAELATIKLNKQFRKNIFGIVTAGAIVLADQLGLLDKLFKDETETLEDSSKALDQNAKATDRLANARKKLLPKEKPTSNIKQGTMSEEMKKLSSEQLIAFNEEREALRQELFELKASNEEIQARNDLMEFGITKDSEKAESLRTLRNEIEQLKALEEIENELEEENKRIREESKDLLEDLGMANKDFTAEMELLNNAHRDGIITTDQYNEALGRLNLKIFESTEAGGILVEGLSRTMDSLSTTMADSLMHMGEGWKGFRDSLKGIARDIIAQFIKIQMQAMITRAIAGMGGGGGFFGGISGLFGGGTGGAPPPTYAPSGGGLMMAANGRTGISANSPYVVGERGPELFVPNTSGSIMSNAQSRKVSGGGGVTVNQSLNFDVGVAQTVRNEILQLMPTIKQQSVDAVINAKERGGRMADVFK